jgi:hypothetical protein
VLRVAASRCRAGLGYELRCGLVFTPGGDAGDHAERRAHTACRDLDCAQPLESSPCHDLPARSVGAREDHQIVVLARRADAVVAAELASQRKAQVGERLLVELRAVGALDRRGVIYAHKQTAQRGAMALGARDLLLQALHQYVDGYRLVGGRWIGGLGVAGGHALWRSVSRGVGSFRRFPVDYSPSAGSCPTLAHRWLLLFATLAQHSALRLLPMP